MGRPFLHYVEDDKSPRFVCAHCGCDIATTEALVWEGYMAHQTPAYLFRNTVNVEAFTPERQEQLSTGMYVLADVRCRSCFTPFGWRYISALSENQKYKERTTLVQKSCLRRQTPETVPAWPTILNRTALPVEVVQ